MRLLTVLSLSFLAAFAAETPDAKALLEESGKALHAYPSYKIEQHMTTDMRGSGVDSHNSFDSRVYAQPGRFRMEMSPGATGVVIVSDGGDTTIYFGALNKYVKRPALDSPEKVAGALIPGMGSFLEQAKSSYTSTKVLREEALDFQGRPVSCYVVEATIGKVPLPAPAKASIQSGRQTVWIEKDRKLVLKHMFDLEMQMGDSTSTVRTHQETVVTRFDPAPVFAPDDFKFTLPKGAQEMKDLPGMPAKD